MALKVSFTAEAQEDLENIASFGTERFGRAQAERYGRSLANFFVLLGQFPNIGAEFSELRSGLRRHVHEAHVIYYRVLENEIRVSRILGPGQDPAREFEP